MPFPWSQRAARKPTAMTQDMTILGLLSLTRAGPADLRVRGGRPPGRNHPIAVSRGFRPMYVLISAPLRRPTCVLYLNGRLEAH